MNEATRVLLALLEQRAVRELSAAPAQQASMDPKDYSATRLYMIQVSSLTPLSRTQINPFGHSLTLD